MPRTKLISAAGCYRARALNLLCIAGLLALPIGAVGAQHSDPQAIVAAITQTVPGDARVQADAGISLDLDISRRLLRRLRPGDRFTLPLPGGRATQLLVRSRHRGTRDALSLRVQVAGADEGYTGLLTIGPQGMVGRVRTPDGIMRIRHSGDRSWIVDSERAGWLMAPQIDTHAPRPPGAQADSDSRLPDQTQFATQPPTSADEQNVTSVLDLMILYTAGMRTRYPGSAFETRMQFLVALSNQALADSNVRIRLRLVHTAMVAYPDTGSNGTALEDLTFGRGGLRDIDDLRNEYGADLVTLIRPYQRFSHGSCGIAWLLGSGGRIPRSDAPYAFSVVSDGQDPNSFYFCTDLALAHELGHNMGSAHDRSNASGPGVLPYSYGYGIPSVFGTVMSYISPELARFSDPGGACFGQPCGIDQTLPNSANNVLSMNTVRQDLSALVPESPNAPELDSDLDGLPDSYEDARPGLDSTNPEDADWDPDGDGRTTIMEYRAGSDPITPQANATVAAHIPEQARFQIRRLNQANSPIFELLFGQRGWQPLAGNWNRDGQDSVAVYNPLTSRFFLKFNNVSGGGADSVFRFGQAGWLPIAGDWNGDGVDTMGLYNPRNSRFFLRDSNTSGPHDLTFVYGQADWIPLAGDWDGDGIDTIGLFNPNTARFSLRNANSKGPSEIAFVFGQRGWRPLVGDWNSDGKDTVGVYNPTTGRFFLRNRNESGPADLVFRHGRANATPLGAVWKRP